MIFFSIVLSALIMRSIIILSCSFIVSPSHLIFLQYPSTYIYLIKYFFSSAETVINQSDSTDTNCLVVYSGVIHGTFVVDVWENLKILSDVSLKA